MFCIIHKLIRVSICGILFLAIGLIGRTIQNYPVAPVLGADTITSEPVQAGRTLDMSNPSAMINSWLLMFMAIDRQDYETHIRAMCVNLLIKTLYEDWPQDPDELSELQTALNGKNMDQCLTILLNDNPKIAAAADSVLKMKKQDGLTEQQWKQEQRKSIQQIRIARLDELEQQMEFAMIRNNTPSPARVNASSEKTLADSLDSMKKSIADPKQKYVFDHLTESLAQIGDEQRMTFYRRYLNNKTVIFFIMTMSEILTGEDGNSIVEQLEQDYDAEN